VFRQNFTRGGEGASAALANELTDCTAADALAMPAAERTCRRLTEALLFRLLMNGIPTT